MAPELQFWPARPSSGNIIWRARLWRLLPRRWQLTPPPPLKKTAAWRWWVISNWFKGANKRETWKTFELRDAFWATGVLQLPKHLEDASAGPSKDFLSMLLVICSGGIRHDSDGGQKMFWGSRSEAQWCWRGGAARLLLSKWADHLRGSGAVCKGQECSTFDPFHPFSTCSQDAVVAHGASSHKQVLLQAVICLYLTASIVNSSL